MTTIYQDMVAAGVPVDNHASDLYAKATPEARAIMRRYPKRHAGLFVSNIDGALWYDVPFAFDPFWEAVARKASRG